MLKFVTSRTRKNPILSVDSGNASVDVIALKQNYATLRFVFKLNLETQGNNPLDYDRVVVSINEAFQQKLETNNKEKIQISTNNIKLRRETTGKNSLFSADTRGISRHRPPQKIPQRSLSRLVANYDIVNKLQNTNLKTNYITSKTIYITDYIQSAISTPYYVTDLIAPEKLTFENSIRLLQDKISTQNVFSEINKTFISPTNLINNDTYSTTDFYKKLTDYLLIDAPKPTNEFLNGLVFYNLVKDTKFLKELEIPCELNVPRAYENIDLIVNFELYEKNNFKPSERNETSFRLDSLINAHSLLQDEITADYSTSHFGTSKQTYNLCFSYDGNDLQKVLGYNIYLKDISQTTTQPAYSQYATVNIQRYSDIISYPIPARKKESILIARITPITSLGEESQKFVDVVMGEGLTRNIDQNLVLIATQEGISTIKVDIKNIKSSEVLKIYRRNCTGSDQSKFFQLARFNSIQSKNFTFFDTKVDFDQIYEYYATVENYQGIEQVSNYFSVNFFGMTEGSQAANVSITNLSRANGILSFLITTIKKSNRSNLSNLYDAALITSNTDSIETSQNLLTSRLKTFKSPVSDDYNDLYFHEVTRISLTTGEKVTFKLMTDGNFIDSSIDDASIQARSRNQTYVYQVQTFYRDPLSSNKNFIITEEKDGTVKLSRPYKWMNPKVNRTGILYAEDSEGMPSIEPYENFTSSCISSIRTSEIAGQSFAYSEIRPIVTRMSRSTLKITWETSTDQQIYYDSHIVVKVVNGKRQILGKCFGNTFYHTLSREDIGTMYYEITCILNDFSIGQTYHTSAFVIEEDRSYITPRLQA